ncbi:hypothetical protein FM21_29260 [Streptomyces mutabilis]|uniref:Uncharacterized protein n=1 Tax=Streptomyces mutabilis TaxID=67332 RepID=A0A086MTN0_9ACTN|nr:hypothetical protein FM21_29260 [Streptomyces mutabilis]
MTGPHSPRLDCPTSTSERLGDAPQPVEVAGVGEPKGAARKGVVTALFPNRSQIRPGGDPTPDAPGIRIFAPPVYRHHYDGARWSIRPGALPTAAYACRCGQTNTATGPEAVAALVAEYDAHKSACTGVPTAPAEGRNAA